MTDGWQPRVLISSRDEFEGDPMLGIPAVSDEDMVPAGKPHAGKRRCWSCTWVER